MAIPVVMAACGSSNAGSVPPLGTTIGPAGGTLVVGSGLLQLDVPAAALAADTIVGVTTGVADSLAGWQVVSSSYEFSPSALAFAVPATLTMPSKLAKLISA